MSLTFLAREDVVSISSEALVLRSSSVARQLPWGSDWQQLMIGVRFRIDGGWVSYGDAVTNMNFGTATAIPRWQVGLCSGGQAVVDDGINHFCGAISFLNTWGNAGTSESDRGYTVGPGGMLIATQIGWTRTSYGGSISAASAGFTATEGLACAIFVQITKGSPTWSLKYAIPNAYSNGDTKTAQQVSVMCETDIENAPTWDSGYQRSNSAGTPTIDESTYGPLDSVCLYWNWQMPRMRIFDIYVHKRY